MSPNGLLQLIFIVIAHSPYCLTPQVQPTTLTQIHAHLLAVLVHCIPEPALPVLVALSEGSSFDDLLHYLTVHFHLRLEYVPG